MKAWQQYLDNLEIDMGKATVKRWLRTLSVKTFDACNLYLEAQDSFQLSWFHEHLRNRVAKELFNENGSRIKIHITLQAESSSPVKTNENTFAKVDNPLEMDTLIDDFLFRNFIVHASNTLPYQILQSLTLETPCIQTPKIGQFNPIYLYGQSGSGKTHLLQALQHALTSLQVKALYVTMETFTENIVSCIRRSSIQQARDFYRSFDVLLFDNSHYLSNKLATQEEFFHTFNFLHGCGRQIVICAPMAPSQLQGIEPRLVSRFEWGLVVRIDPLTPQEMLSIAQARLQRLHLAVVNDDLKKIFSLLGNDLSAVHTFCDALALRSYDRDLARPFTFKEIEKITGDLFTRAKKKVLKPPEIIEKLAIHFAISPEDILSRQQNSSCTLVRKLAMYLCRASLQMPYKKIGELFTRDHSTVMTSIKNIETKIENKDSRILAALALFSDRS